MKHALMLLACLMLPGGARAQTHVDGRSVPCGQLAAIVQNRGAVVIDTGPYAYDRYVSGGHFCLRPEIAVPAWIGTLDAPLCFVGYVCRDRQRSSAR